MRSIALILPSLFVAAAGLAEDTVRLKATADVWLSDAVAEERDSSAGKLDRIKIKTIQEMAAIRFDAAPAKGREIKSAKLFFCRAGDDMLRHIRVSTVNQDWEEGEGKQTYGPGNGATFNHADHASKKLWAWPGSQFCDVVMSSGQTLVHTVECKKLDKGWVSVDLTPELVYALVCGDTDGLCVMDGGTIALNNNFIFSHEAKGREPYLEVVLGGKLDVTPAAPKVMAAPAPERASLKAGALKLAIAHDKDVFCWKITLDGAPVERWRVHHPKKEGETVFYLTGLPPAKQVQLEVVAVAAGGKASPAFKTGVQTSPALAAPPELGALAKPTGGSAPPEASGKLRVWALPGMVKISPEKAEPMYGEEVVDGKIGEVNAVWNGKEVHLHGGRGEYAGWQLCIENISGGPLSAIKVSGTELKGPGGAVIGTGEIELYRNWYAQNKDKKWQPAYAIPLKHGEAFEIPDSKRNLATQQNQTVSVDLYIPKDAKPGDYAGSISVEADGVPAVAIPVKVHVYDFVLPDKLSFWPELNTYQRPKATHDYYRLAHLHRCILNIGGNSYAPALQGKGKNVKCDWSKYDEEAGPLLSGEAFKDCRRAGQPLECMYLAYGDSWPSPLTPETYLYKGSWYTSREGLRKDPKAMQVMNEHYLTAPYIGDALTQEYKDQWLAVQKQFIEHFKEKGWNRTEMQCFYGGKKTHRVDFNKRDMWWTTDEPYHWDDWESLHFFCRMWTEGRKAAGGDPKIWMARGDISRPNWQGRVLDGIIDCQYGGFGNESGQPRLYALRDDTGVDIRSYGSTNSDNSSNTGSVALLLNIYLSGGNAHLPWQTLGKETSLDTGDAGVGGAAILVPGTRFGVPVVGDLRLKALREAQQIIEYLVILGAKKKLTREQMEAMVQKAMPFEAGRKKNAAADNADAMRYSTLNAWQLGELRRKLAEQITK